jgi:hypothetical protein
MYLYLSFIYTYIYIYIYIYMAGSRLWPLYLEVKKPAVPISSLFQPPAVSTKHSVGHVLLSSRYDLAQFSFNPTFHRAHFILIQTPFSFNQALSRACFVVIQIRSGPVQFRPYILSGTFYSHPDPIQFQPSTQSGPFCCHPDTIWPSSVSTIVSITTSDWHGADLISNLDIIYIYIYI